MNDTYGTSDFAETTFLSASDISMTDIQRNGQRLVFVFRNREKCESLVRRLRLGDDQISATRLLSASRHIKRLVHQY